jgi:hypothetical protein
MAQGTQPQATQSDPRLIEQYKMYVEMADRVSARRADTNKFYISLLTALLAILLLVVEKNIFSSLQSLVFLAIALLGAALCFVWVINIRSYSQLNTGKFAVIHDMEKQLPYACYDREWDILGRGEDRKKYFQLTRIEQYVPFLLAVPYLILFIYAIYSLIHH